MGKEAGGEFWVLHRWLRGAIRARNPRLMVGFMLFWPKKCQSVTDNAGLDRVTRADWTQIHHHGSAWESGSGAATTTRLTSTLYTQI